MRSLLRLFSKNDPRATAGGAVMVEFLIAYMPVLISFLMFWQVGELLVAQMVVERASSAAGRAAVVVVPDDPAFYGTEPQDSYTGSRKREVRLAAGEMLAASPHLSENFTVDIKNIPAGGGDPQEITVEVDAEFRCNRLKWVCGADGVAVLKSTSLATYQGAKYQYEPSDPSAAFNSNSSSNEPGCSDTDTPNSGGGSNHGGSGNGGNSHGGVPGKGGSGGMGGKGGNAGHGGNDPDSSGSCPAGETMQKDGTCARTRSGGQGYCPDTGRPPSRPDGLCDDRRCPAPDKNHTANRPSPNNDLSDPCDPSSACFFKNQASNGGCTTNLSKAQCDKLKRDVCPPARQGTVFWSGTGAEDAASAWARNHGSPTYGPQNTLEDRLTDGGWNIKGAAPASVDQNSPTSGWNRTQPTRSDNKCVQQNINAFWTDVSKFLAECTVGTPIFYPGPNIRDNGWWANTELPQLTAGGSGIDEIKAVDPNNPYGPLVTIWKRSDGPITAGDCAKSRPPLACTGSQAH